MTCYQHRGLIAGKSKETASIYTKKSSFCYNTNIVNRKLSKGVHYFYVQQLNRLNY